MKGAPAFQKVMSRVRFSSQDRLDEVITSGAEDFEQLRLDDIRSGSREISDIDIASPDAMEVKSVELSECSIRDDHSGPQVSPTSSSSVEAEQIFNPFQLRSRKSMRVHSQQIIDSLKFNAVELVIECLDLVRSEMFSSPKCFVALFGQGVTPGEWELLDKSEDVTIDAHMRFLKKFRLRAATELDRQERLLIAFFDRASPQNSLNPMKGLCHTEFTVAELLESKQMIMEKELKTPRKRSTPRPSVILALEMVYHIEHDQKTTFELGFLESAPLRNRMFFVISRALRRGKWSPVYRSEVRLRDDVEKFDPITLGEQEFHGGDMSKLFRIEVHRAYKNGHSKLLGFIQTSCEKLSSMEINGQLYWWPATEGITSAKVIIQYVEKGDNEVWYSLRLAGHS